MNELQLKAYFENNGIPHTTTGKRLRVMDKSLLPQAYRDWFDERGFLKEGKMDKTKQDEEAQLEAAKKLTKKIDAVAPMGETEKEMTTVGLLNPEGDTKVPAHLESHEPKVSSLLEKEIDSGKTALKGSLPDDFPGKAALEAEGHTTYAKVRKLRAAGTLTSVPGIGKATAAQIDEVFENE